MQFPPMTYTTPGFDPIVHDRLESGRPASRLEIMERYQREFRHANMVAMTDEQSSRGSYVAVPGAIVDAFEGVRRSISRVLINAGERINPGAA